MRATRARASSPSPRRANEPPRKRSDSSQPNSIDDLLVEPGPKVKGFTQREGWSGDAFDLGALDIIDADAKLSLAGLTYGGMHVDNSEVRARAEGPRAQDDARGHQPLPGPRQRRRHRRRHRQGGAPCGRLLALRHRRPAAAARIPPASTGSPAGTKGAFRSRATAPARRRSCSRSTARPTLRSAMGPSPASIWRVPCSELRDGNLPDFETSPSKKTNFSALTGSFVITDGVAHNDDLKLVSPRLARHRLRRDRSARAQPRLHREADAHRQRRRRERQKRPRRHRGAHPHLRAFGRAEDLSLTSRAPSAARRTSTR